MANPLDALARRMGIKASYTDQLHRRRRTSRATKAALLRAMGLDPSRAAEHLADLGKADANRRLPAYKVCDEGRPPVLDSAQSWRLSLEDGQQSEGRGALPRLPLGLHALEVDGETTTLISCPRRLPLPQRAWGVMLPLHALRSPQEGGLATYADLAEAGEGLSVHGASYLGLNPIHAGFWADPGGYSPYTPSHRRRLNSFFLTDDVDAPPSDNRIDYASEIPHRKQKLKAAFAAFDGSPDFERYKTEGGQALARFALHQALSDRHGAYWTDWPAALHDHESPQAKDAERELQRDIDFHIWLQWRAENELTAAQERLHRAGMHTGLYLDLAVGTHPAGAETWEDRDSFAYGTSLGAPPDAFAANGQSWGLAPFNPVALIAKGFAPLAETLRRQFQFAGAVRIDHILGFDRAFWVPEDGTPGAYVEMPRAAMLAVARLEAARAGSFIVGEDLGNVPRGLRPALARAGILGCQLQLFERESAEPKNYKDPQAFPEASMASFSTHDLPTWLGWRSGLEIKTHRDLGHISAPIAQQALAERRADVANFDAMTAAYRPSDCPAESVDAMHHALAATSSALVLLQIENMLDIAEQPNLPGTTTQYPNWRQRLPVAVDALGHHPGLQRASAIMTRGGR